MHTSIQSSNQVGWVKNQMRRMRPFLVGFHQDGHHCEADDLTNCMGKFSGQVSAKVCRIRVHCPLSLKLLGSLLSIARRKIRTRQTVNEKGERAISAQLSCAFATLRFQQGFLIHFLNDNLEILSFFKLFKGLNKITFQTSLV